MTEIEELDTLKTKVLKYVIYKKRTEYEIRKKFSENAGNLLENVIEFLKDNNYINDEKYIEKAINEFINLKNMSINEIKYKLIAKGIKKEQLEEYIYKNREELLEYELKSAQAIMIKKQRTTEKEQVIMYLKRKGYLSQTIEQLGEDDE